MREALAMDGPSPNPLQIPLSRSGGAGAEPLPSSKTGAPQTTRGVHGGRLASPLDPLETTSQPQCRCGDDDHSLPWVNPDAVPFEHRGWAADRRRIYAALCRTDQTADRRHAFANCRSHVHVYQDSATGELELFPETCKDRFCLPCGQTRSRRIAQALEPRMKAAASKLQFITLTVRGRPDDSLVGQIEKLSAAWKSLRKLDGWKNSIGGGAIMLEVKWSKFSGGHWHPHYHLITEGSGVDEAWLRHAWATVTGDSDQVNVQWVKEAAKALSYVTKYASKPLDASFVRRPALIDEAMRALKGRRLAALFGSWYGIPLKEEYEDEEAEVLTTWGYVGTVGDLECRAERGDAEARALLVRARAILALRALGALRRRGPPADSLPPSASIGSTEVGPFADAPTVQAAGSSGVAEMAGL